MFEKKKILAQVPWRRAGAGGGGDNLNTLPARPFTIDPVPREGSMERGGGLLQLDLPLVGCRDSLAPRGGVSLSN